MDRFRLYVLFACAPMIALQACCTKNKCASSIELTVIGADGSVLKQADGVTVDGSAIAVPCDGHASCSFQIRNAGDYTVWVEGYRPATFHVDIERDDCDNALSQSIEIKLVPDGDNAAPSIQRSLSAC